MKKFAKILSVVLAVSILSAAFAIMPSAATQKRYELDFTMGGSSNGIDDYYALYYFEGTVPETGSVAYIEANKRTFTAGNFALSNAYATKVDGFTASVSSGKEAFVFKDTASGGNNENYIWAAGSVTVIIEFTAPVAGTYTHYSKASGGHGRFSMNGTEGYGNLNTGNEMGLWKYKSSQKNGPIWGCYARPNFLSYDLWENNVNSLNGSGNAPYNLQKGEKLYFVITGHNQFRVQFTEFYFTGPTDNTNTSDTALVGAITLAAASLAGVALIIRKKRKL